MQIMCKESNMSPHRIRLRIPPVRPSDSNSQLAHFTRVKIETMCNALKAVTCFEHQAVVVVVFVVACLTS